MTLNIPLLYDALITFLDTQETWKHTCLHNVVYKHIHNSFIITAQNRKQPESLSTDKYTNSLCHAHVILSIHRNTTHLEKGRANDMRGNMDKSQRKPDTRVWTV